MQTMGLSAKYGFLFFFQAESDQCNGFTPDHLRRIGTFSARSCVSLAASSVESTRFGIVRKYKPDSKRTNSLSVSMTADIPRPVNACLRIQHSAPEAALVKLIPNLSAAHSSKQKIVEASLRGSTYHKYKPDQDSHGYESRLQL